MHHFCLKLSIIFFLLAINYCYARKGHIICCYASFISTKLGNSTTPGMDRVLGTVHIAHDFIRWAWFTSHALWQLYYSTLNSTQTPFVLHVYNLRALQTKSSAQMHAHVCAYKLMHTMPRRVKKSIHLPLGNCQSFVTVSHLLHPRCRKRTA